jgi:hypothetical protein
MKKFDAIVVCYWHSKLTECKYDHNEGFLYSQRMQTQIINYILGLNLSVMLRPNGRVLNIYIDNGRFGQR